MITEIVLQATPRDERGKNAARRLRAEGRLPVALYGEGIDAMPVSINTRELGAILRSESGRNSIFTLAIDGVDSTPVKIHSIDFDPVTNRPLHMDLMRISMTNTTRVSVRIEFTGEPAGVKQDGGMLEVHLHELEIECLPRDIPQSISIDVTDMVVGDHLTVAQLPVDRDNITVLNDPDHLVAVVSAPRASAEPEEAPAVAPAPAPAPES